MHMYYTQISAGLIVAMALAGSVVLFGVFSAVEVVTPPSYVLTEGVPPELSARAWQVFDMHTGEVLFAEEDDVVLPIASITKLFTASAILEHAELASSTDITWGDVRTEGRAGKLQFGDTYTNRELLFPLLLESSNDAATAFERVHPSLIDDVDAYTNMLHLEQTRIEDGSGLSDGNVSTAHELGIALRYMYRTQPELFDITRISSYYAEDNGWINNSPFVEDVSYRGGKHGFTYSAGRTATIFFEEELHGGAVRLIGYVLLGSEDLARDMTVLRDFVRTNTAFR